MSGSIIAGAVTLRDGLGFDDIVAYAAGIMTICGFLWWLLRPLVRQAQRFDHFWDDWHGTTGTPGRDAVPGVMERLQRIDGELKRNGGGSMKDRIFSLDRKIDDLAENKAHEHAQIRDDIQELRESIEQDKP